MQFYLSDFKIFRFANLKPDSARPEKYQYQLFRKGVQIMDRFSNEEYFKGEISISTSRLEMKLISSASEISEKEMEDENVFLVDVTIVN